MRLLFVHSEYFAFEATTEADEDLATREDAPADGRVEDCVAAFGTVEGGDERAPEATAANAAAEIRSVADQLSARTVALYPSAHLSRTPANPASAAAVFRELEARLDADHEVLRAPVGRHAGFELSSKGHPFAEQSRHVGPDAGRSEAGDSDRRIAFPDGTSTPAREADDDERVGEEMRTLVRTEVEGDGDAADREHLERLRDEGLGRVDRDAGTFRWHPRGKFVRDSLLAYATNLAIEAGALPVEAVDGVDSGARPAGDGARSTDPRVEVFPANHLPERDLPARIYEPTAGSFRAGPAFATPTIRTATRDADRAKAEFETQCERALSAGDDLGVEYRPVIRVSRSFYETDSEWITSLIADLDAPALIEIRDHSCRDRAVTAEFATIDRDGDPLFGPTVRLDLGLATRTDGGDADSERAALPTVHAAPLGAVDRATAVLLDGAAERTPPRLPTWLSPIQVRFVPIGDDHVERCARLAGDLAAAGLRADVDDRDAPVGERIAAAERERAPYYAVVGDRELDRDDEALAVCVRSERAERRLSPEQLRDHIRDDVGDRPQKRRYLPRRVGDRPEFGTE